jgi:hypothetical protein
VPLFQTTDTVLVLGLDRRDFVVRLAPSVRLLVGVGEEDDVRAARREFAALDNVMFVEGNREEIPWAAAQFSVIIDLSSLKPTAEMLRVLKSGGHIAQSV